MRNPSLNSTPFFEHYWIWIAACLIVILVAVAYMIVRKRHRTQNRNQDVDYYIQGLNHIIAGNKVEAVRSLTRAIRINTDNVDAYLKLGNLYRQSGKGDKAVQIHRELTIRSDLPEKCSAEVFRELAKDLEQTGNLAPALKYINSAHKLEQNAIDNYPIRLRILEKLQRWEEAVQVYREYAALVESTDGTREAYLLVQWGKKLDSQDQGHEARLRYKKALKIQTDSIDARLAIAESYIREERFSDAMDWLQEIFTDHPVRADKALPALEKLLFEQGRFSDIEQILKRSTQKAPGNALLMIHLVDILEKKGNFDEAYQVCNKALEENPDNMALLLRRLRIMKQMEDDTQFDNELNRLIQVDEYRVDG